MTILDDYPKYSGKATVSPTLLWEYDLSDFDWWKSRRVVVQRVIERGWLNDFYAILNMYGGFEGVREIIKDIPFLSGMDINFVCNTFNLKKEDLRCCTRKQSRERLLSY